MVQKTLQDVCTAMLPVDERLTVKRCRYVPQTVDPETGLNRTGRKVPQLCIVTGIHGDELEGQYVCYELSRYLSQENTELDGLIDIYPALNPLGIDTITRGIPSFDLDMNRIFPGNLDGSMPETLAQNIMKSLKGADMVAVQQVYIVSRVVAVLREM